MRRGIAKVFIMVLTLMFLSGVAVDEAQSMAIVQETWTSNVGQQIPDGPSGGGHGTPLLDTIDVLLGSIPGATLTRPIH